MMITELVDGEDFRQRLISIGLVPPVEASPADLAELTACRYQAGGLDALPETITDLLRYKDVMLPEVLQAIETHLLPVIKDGRADLQG